jgi:hypothetical protein
MSLLEKAHLAEAFVVLDDSNNKAPRIPHDEGTLQSTGSATVRREGNEIIGEVAYNSPYAAYQHEGQRADGTHVVTEYSKSDGRGPKFLETALFENVAARLARIASRVRKGLGNG